MQSRADGRRNPRRSDRSQSGWNYRCGARIRCEFYRRQTRYWRDHSGDGRLPQGSHRQGGQRKNGRLPANYLLWIERSARLSADRHIQGQADQFDREAEERASERKDDMIESDFESLKRGLAQVADYKAGARMGYAVHAPVDIKSIRAKTKIGRAHV